MPRESAGLLVFRRRSKDIEVLLVHPGGPFWARRDAGAWSLPKGEYEQGEDPLTVALREFEEELGLPPPPGPRLELGSVRQAGGKRVVAWGVAGDVDVTQVKSNTFELEWPPRSGRRQEFPEVDRAGWWALGGEAEEKLLTSQHPFLSRLASQLVAPEDNRC